LSLVIFYKLDVVLCFLYLGGPRALQRQIVTSAPNVNLIDTS